MKDSAGVGCTRNVHMFRLPNNSSNYFFFKSQLYFYSLLNNFLNLYFIRHQLITRSYYAGKTMSNVVEGVLVAMTSSWSITLPNQTTLPMVFNLQPPFKNHRYEKTALRYSVSVIFTISMLFCFLFLVKAIHLLTRFSLSTVNPVHTTL